MYKFLTMALALASTVITACSSSNDSIANSPKQPENQSKTITLKTTVGFDNKAGTRALTSNGVKTFAVGETMALRYANKSNKWTVKESEPLKAGDIAADGKSATFTFNLTEEPNKNSSVNYYYPAAMLKADGTENYEALLTEQDGTLAKLASNFDFAAANNLDWAGDNLPGATLTNKLAILAITLKDDVTGDDITSSITGLTITARDAYFNSKTYNITCSAAPGPIYVAIVPTAESEFEVTATDGTNTYVKTLTDKTYKINNGYNVSWKMTNATPLSNTTPLTMEALTDGNIVVKNPREGMQYSVNGGAKISISSTENPKTITVEAGDKVQFYGNGQSITSYERTMIAGGSAQVKVYGNIMSLVNETGFATATTFESKNNFRRLLYNNTTLTNASSLLLPAKTLADNCYKEMFSGCINLRAVTCLATNISATLCTEE